MARQTPTQAGNEAGRPRYGTVATLVSLGLAAMLIGGHLSTD